MTDAPRLRVGVLVDDESIPRWASEMLARVLTEGHADVVLVVTNGASPRRRGGGTAALLGGALYRLVARLDRWLSAGAPDPFAPADLRSLLPDAPRLVVVPERTARSDRFPADAVSTIRGAECDVLIRLGFGVLRGDILTAARAGVWSYHHGDPQRYRGVPAGSWEVIEGASVTGSALQILGEDLDGGAVICRSFSQTDRILMARNRSGPYWKGVAFVPRELRRLRRLGVEAFLERVRKRNQDPVFYSRKLYRLPGSRDVIRLALRRYGAYLVRKFASLFFVEQWVLLCAFAKREELSLSLRRFRTIVPPRDRFWADPSVVHEDGRYHVFAEELVQRHGRGRIVRIEVDETGARSAPVVVLERPYHLSYPFVFRHGDDWFMVPETAEARTVQLYRAAPFPDRWEHVIDLMRDVEAVDTTVLRHDGRWWLFTTIREHPGAPPLDELFLFCSEDLVSAQWTAHSENPVVSDVRGARSAGRILCLDGRLYRPSQDSSRRYGYRIRLHRIEKLTTDEYEEAPVGEIAPEWDPRILATHTLDHAGRITVVDGLLRRPRLFA